MGKPDCACERCNTGKQIQLQIAKPSIDKGLKRAILKSLRDHSASIVRQATIPEKAVVYTEPDSEVLNYAYARLDTFIDFFEGQEF